MDKTSEHETDFVGWTENQAGILRSVPAGTLGLDTANLAEEIADLGRSELRQTSSLLRQVLVHLIKIAAEPNAKAVDHWLDEVLAFQADAVFACSSGMRQRIDLVAVWRLARNSAARSLRTRGVALVGLPAECPFDLDTLLDLEFDPMAAVETLAAAIGSEKVRN